MIISPEGLAITNVLHAVNNSYKCTDQVYMFSQTEEDCNLYIKKLYWERDPESDYEAPVFPFPRDSIMLIRQDLVDADRDNPGNGTQIPIRTHNRDGYSMQDELFDSFEIRRRDRYYDDFIPPLPRLQNSDVNNTTFNKFLLTQPYFAPHSMRLQKQGRNVMPDDLEDFNIKTAPALRLRFGEERMVYAILFYRTFWGRHIDWSMSDNDEHSVQLLLLPEYADVYEKIFDSNEAKDYAEPDEEQLRITISIEQFPYNRKAYFGGVPCIANLDTPVTTKEIFLRWSGYLTHVQLLDAPIIRPEYWTLADNENMLYSWPHLAERILQANSSTTQQDIDTPIVEPENWVAIENDREKTDDHIRTVDAIAGLDFDISQRTYEYRGDISIGISFVHPCDRDYFNDYAIGDCPWHCRSRGPYHTIDYYTAECITSYDGQYDAQAISDEWQLEGFDNCGHDFDADGNIRDRDSQYNRNHFVHKINNNIEYVVRDVGDNQTYVANKSLLSWYYTPETNSWKSKYTRPSTPNQMRLLVAFPSTQIIKGCINPMSVPATFNKPTFFKSGNRYRFNPGVYADYIVPWRVLVEGKADNNVRTPWELMDEFALEHFSARAHTYFPYPREVKFIRITIQDWYGNTLMDDIKNDYVYNDPGTQHKTTLGHYDKYSAVNPDARSLVLHHSPHNIGTMMASADYTALQAEWQMWKDRTIQSLWKGIYIPPFLFFGGK